MAEYQVSVGPTQLGASAATLYTITAGRTGSLIQLWLFNTDSAERKVTMSIGTDAAGTRILDDYLLPAKSAEQVTGAFFVAASTVLQGFADVASKVNVHMSIVEIG